MFVRVVTFTGAKDVDGGLEFLRNTVAPLLRQQKGWAGTTASVDRDNGVFGVLTLWETATDRDASENAMGQVRAEANDIVGGELGVEFYEQVVFDVVQPPRIGARLLLRTISMDPATVDENIEFFKSEVLPRIKAGSGYLALRNLINRETGEGAVGSLWESDSALQAAATAAEERRPIGEQRGITFGEQSRRETVFADMP
jgi:heme-degrading monooxygenase HmoA